MRAIAILTAVMALTSCSVASAHASGGHAERTFRDWYAVCDNVNSCYAFGKANEGTGWVRVAIPAGPEARPGVVFGFWPEDGTFTGALKADIDGETFSAQTVGDSGPDYPVAMIPEGVSQALVAAMGRGQSMTVTAGSQGVPISLDGSAAALLWIDERQGRLDTPTALIRKGPRPPSGVPAAPLPPRVTPAAAVAQPPYGEQEGQTLPAAIEALPEVVECRADTDFNPDLQAAITSARLDARTILWAVPCGAGAYNFSTAWFTARPDGSDPRRLVFSGTDEVMDRLVNAAYDPETRVMDTFNKGRGLGDCGIAARWTWTDRGFVLTSSSAMSDCHGVPSDFWPTLWVTR